METNLNFESYTAPYHLLLDAFVARVILNLFVLSLSGK